MPLRPNVNVESGDSSLIRYPLELRLRIIIDYISLRPSRSTLPTPVSIRLSIIKFYSLLCISLMIHMISIIKINIKIALCSPMWRSFLEKFNGMNILMYEDEWTHKTLIRTGSTNFHLQKPLCQTHSNVAKDWILKNIKKF